MDMHARDAVRHRSFNCTFGHHTQKAAWTDQRRLTWTELCHLLTRHEVGAKEGICIVPAVFSGTQRRKDAAVQIDIAMLDSDGGATLKEIEKAIAAMGWATIISSTHSHLNTTTRLSRSVWDRFVQQNGSQATPETLLLQEKGFRPEIACGARVDDLGETEVVLHHQPCPKFRIVLPLLRPWRAADYPDQDTANAAWKGRVEALAAALGLAHDQSCTDTSRLFYLPRRPAYGPATETAVLEGELCDIFALPDPPPAGAGGTSSRHTKPDDAADYMDPMTGQVFDLRDWAAHYGDRFQLIKALRARRPQALLAKVVDGTKHHIRCPNEGEHTQAGDDFATFVMDPGTGTEAKGFVIHCRHGHCDGRDRLFFVRRMLEQGWLRTEDLTDLSFVGAPNTTAVRPVIRYVPGEMPRVVNEAEDALLRAGLGIYQRGASIVRPGRVMITVSNGREVPAQRVVEVGEHALAEMMTEAARWEKLDARSGKWVPTDVPARVAATYRERIGQWRLPILAGIITGPTLRPDGSLLANPGYDPSSGLLLDTRGISFPLVPDRPSRHDAVAALEAIQGLIGSFPFVAAIDCSVALSAILTASIRRALPTAPLHAFTAPVAGSGKSTLVDLASIIATGREAGVLSQSNKEEELEKRLGAMLLAGQQVIAIDNCEAPLGGDFLCLMLTQQVVRCRILGRSETPEMPANAFVTATGNNLALLGDMTRRTVLCRLDPKRERPELRQFNSRPLQRAKDERPRLLSAALTVLRAYHVAGRPTQKSPLGSFEDWSSIVRGALLWLDQADPIGTMEEARSSDPSLEALTAVLTNWHAAIGPGEVSVRDIIDAATHAAPRVIGTSAAPGGNSGSAPDLREALLVVAGEGGAINSRRLGRWLANHQDRIVGGLRIVRTRMRTGVQLWRVVSEAEAAADAA